MKSTDASGTVKTVVIVFLWIISWSALLLFFAMSESKADTYEWKVISVHDGDTFTVDTKFFPEELGNIKIRIKGIDTGEMGYRAKCNREAALAQKAKQITEMYILGKTVVISDVEADKYGNRIVANVEVDNKNLADILLEKGLAKVYDGGTKQSWCN